MPDEHERELQRLFDVELPRLLQKPASKWTKAEIWTAIKLHFKRPSGGLINWRIYAALDAKLRGEPVDPCYFPVSRKKGRPQKFAKEEYQRQLKSVERLRQQMAAEKRVAIDKVTYKQVARRMAERAFANKEPKVSERKLRELADRYAIHYKALNKKKKAGEI